MTTREVLVQARALVARGWTKGAFARARNGRKVPLYADNACRWCAAGALRRAYVEASTRCRLPRLSGAFTALVSAGPGEGPESNKDAVVEYNDALATQDDALAWFDRAIKRCRKR